MFVLINTLAVLVPYSIEHSLVEVVKIENLKEGMILSEPIEREEDFKEGAKKLSSYNILRVIKQNLTMERTSRLTKNDINSLMEMHKSGKLDYKTVRVAKTIPFAPFMFFGVLVTYFLQGSFLSYLLL
jgi:hypothetical protein